MGIVEPDNRSLKEKLESLPSEKQQAFKLELLESLRLSPSFQAHQKRDKKKKLWKLEDDPEAAATPEASKDDLDNIDFMLNYLWPYNARPKQVVPWHRDDWSTFVAQAGRGFGKTKTLSEAILEHVRDVGASARIALIAPTAADTRDVMVKGAKSGILACSPPWMPAVYSPSNRNVTWPTVGAVATLFSSEEPDRIRGFQFTMLACDEYSSWKNDLETWDMAQMALRLGRHPRAVCTSTPKPTPLVKLLMNDPMSLIVSGSSYENATNLPKSYLDTIRRRYEGTKLGEQEVHARVTFDAIDALWKSATIDETRVPAMGHNAIMVAFKRIVVAVDPSVTANASSDEAGIMVCGVGAGTYPGIEEDHLYIIEDATAKLTPEGWARRAIELFIKYRADKIVAETNNGGLMVPLTIHNYNSDGVCGRNVPVKVVTATKGKWTRAEPIASLWEQNRAHMVGTHEKLERQLCEFSPFAGKKSPDRLDAMVWGGTELMLEHAGHQFW